MNIVLIGYRCSGKTSVGRIIAERAGMTFYDSDILIEKTAGRNIERIVEADGWDGFRAIERQAIRDLSQQDNAVIATGGGVVISNENIIHLKKNGRIVWLEGDVDILMRRMEKDRSKGNARPSLTGVDPVVETKKVLEMRNPLYRQAAELAINTDSLSPDEVAEKILQAFSGQLI